MLQQLSEAVGASAADLVEWRRHLHKHPEISFQEHETTRWLASLLTAWGVPFTTPTPTGLVAEIAGRLPGPTIALRADLDALPITEENPFEFRSSRPGVMHACGHDGHTAILLGLVRFFQQHPEFPGKIRFLFQPAEELPPGGATQFVAAGVLDGVAACMGLHLMADLPTGSAGIDSGPLMANSDKFRVRIKGKGGHGSAPHQTVDAVMVACHAVVNLQTIVSRKVSPIQPAVVSIGAIHAGTTFNVIADTAELMGTVRSFDPDVRQQLHDEIARTLRTTCDLYGAEVELAYEYGYPACVNDPEMTEVMREAAAAVLGRANVVKQEPIMGGEDFAYYGQVVPAAFLFVGCQSEAAGAVWPHHHPRFTVDERALPLGMEILGRAALTLLGRG